MRPSRSNYKVAKGWLDLLREDLKTRELDGLVLHYDLTAKLRRRHFRLNRKLVDLLKIPGSIIVVNLKVPTDRLIGQLAQNKLGARPIKSVRQMLLSLRAHQAIRSATAFVGKMLPRRVVARLKRLRPLSPMWRMPDRKLQKQLLKVKHYRREGWLDDLHEQWSDSLRAAANPTATIKQVYVEPEAQDIRYTWRRV